MGSLERDNYTWERVRVALAAYVEEVTGLPSADPGDGTARVAWDYNDQGPMPKPHVSIGFISDTSSGFANEYLREVPTVQRLTVTQTTVGEAVACQLIWADVRTAVEAGDDLTATRDKFLAAMQAKIDRNQEPLTVAVDGAASILVSALTYAYPDVEAIIGCTLDDSAPASALAEVTSVEVTMRVRVQLFGYPLSASQAEADPLKKSMHGQASKVRRGLESSRGLAFLKDFGVGVQGRPATIQQATVKSGGLQELRTFFDVTIATRETSYLFATEDPSVDETIDQVDPPNIDGAFV